MVDFFEWEINTDCWNQSCISVTETFLKQGLYADSDISGLEKVVEAAKLFVKATDDIAARTRKMIWEEPLGLVPKQSFLSLITHFLFSCFEYWSMFEMAKGLLLSKWYANWRAWLLRIDLDTLLALDCASTGVLIKIEDYLPGAWLWCICYQDI